MSVSWLSLSLLPFFHHSLCLSFFVSLHVQSPVSTSLLHPSLINLNVKCTTLLKYSQLKSISNYSHLCSGNCLCWLPTNSELWACQIWRSRGCWGAAAAGADVPPNYRSPHAESILLNHFKASAMGFTARLNQLQNASPVSISSCWIDFVVLCALRQEEGKRYWKKEIRNPGHG